VLSGRTTQAEGEGWPVDSAQHDEPPTARTRPPVRVDEDATRKTSPTHLILRAAEVNPTVKPRRSASRFVTVAFLLLAFFVIGHELAIASRAERLKADVPAADLDGIGGMWARYHALGSRSLKLTTASLEEALTRRTIMLGDRIIGNYRMPA